VNIRAALGAAAILGGSFAIGAVVAWLPTASTIATVVLFSPMVWMAWYAMYLGLDR